MKLQVDRSVCPAFWVKVSLAYDLDTLDGCLCCGMPYDIASGKVDSIEITRERAESILLWCQKDIWKIGLFTEEPVELAPLGVAFKEQAWSHTNHWPKQAPFPIWIEP